MRGLIEKELNEIKLPDKTYNILLSHRPEAFDLYVNKKVDLTLTGHAHGGQFRLPLIGGLYAPGQGLLPKYTSSLHEKDGKRMIISRGIGNSSFPIRINNRPELIIINLEGEK